jgi:hypothetical protein
LPKIPRLDVRSLVRPGATAAAALLLLACAEPPAPPSSGAASRVDDALEAVYAGLKSQGGRVLRFDPQGSTVRIFAFRGGKAARLGHNHVLTAPRFRGLLYVPASGVQGVRCDLEFRLDELQIDDPALREQIGGVFGGGIAPEDIEATRSHMLGDDGLQAARFPFLHVQCLQVGGELPELAATLRIELHGKAQELTLPLQVAGLPGAATVRGAMVLRQSAFGVRPYSVFGGMLAVQDEVVIDFALRAG